MLPFEVQVASVIEKSASTTPSTLMSGSVPHLGLMVAEFSGQTLFGEASVQARNRLVSFSVWLHSRVIVPKGNVVILLAAIGPLHPVILVVLTSLPEASYTSSVPQNANDVRVDPVLLLIASINVLVPEQAHWSPAGGGRVADINSRSFEVQELADGNVCANAFDEIKNNNVKNRVFTGRSK